MTVQEYPAEIVDLAPCDDDCTLVIRHDRHWIDGLNQVLAGLTRTIPMDLRALPPPGVECDKSSDRSSNTMDLEAFAWLPLHEP